MKPFFVVLLIVTAMSYTISAQTQSYTWAKSMGGPTADRPESITVDRWGNVLSVGKFSDTSDFDPGSGVANLIVPGIGQIPGVSVFGFFISKLDSAGNYVWAKQMGTPAGGVAGMPYDVAVDATGAVYVSGWYGGVVDFDPGPGVFNMGPAGGGTVTAFVLKLDSAGNFKWAKSFAGGSIDVAYSVAVDKVGNVLLCGVFGDTVDFDPGPGTHLLGSNGQDDAFVLKLDSTGNYMWAAKIGGSSIEAASAVAVDSTGAVYATGYFQGTADFDPGASAFNLSSAGDYDAFIIKLDISGNLVWAKRIGGAGPEKGWALETGKTGAAYSAGTFTGTADFDPGSPTYNLTSAGDLDSYVLRLATDGSFSWAGRMGGSRYDAPTSLALDSADDVYITGAFSGPADFDPGPGIFSLTGPFTAPGAFVAKLSGTGAFQWANTVGNGIAIGNGVAIDKNNNVYSNGSYMGTAIIDLNTGLSLISVGEGDVYVCKIGQEFPVSVETNPPGGKDDYTIYPNPSTGRLVIKSTRGALSNAHIQVIDASGRLVEQYHSDNEDTYGIDFGKHPAGVYYLHILSEHANGVSFQVIRR